MVTKASILSKVRLVLSQTFELDTETIVPEAHLYEHLDLDSLDAIDLAVKLKSEHRISLSEEDMVKLRTVGDIVDLIYAFCEADQTIEI